MLPESSVYPRLLGMPEELISVPEVADLLDVTEETVRRWAETGLLRHVRLPSGRFRFERSDIEAIRRPIEPTVL